MILQIWDTAGQERFQSLSSAFYRGADCCCLVYDVTKEDSFQALANWKQIFMQKSNPNDPETFPFVCIGNKVDLTDNRRVSTADGQRFCKDNGNMLFYESSAKNNFNVEQAFKDLGAAAIKRQIGS